MLIGTINWGVETCRNKLEKHKENEEKMCSTYVVTIVRRIRRTFYVVIFARVNESLMNEKNSCYCCSSAVFQTFGYTSNLLGSKFSVEILGDLSSTLLT